MADLSSDVNYNKKGLRRLLDTVIDGQIGRLVVVIHKDRRQQSVDPMVLQHTQGCGRFVRQPLGQLLGSLFIALPKVGSVTHRQQRATICGVNVMTHALLVCGMQTGGERQCGWRDQCFKRRGTPVRKTDRAQGMHKAGRRPSLLTQGRFL